MAQPLNRPKPTRRILVQPRHEPYYFVMGVPQPSEPSRQLAVTLEEAGLSLLERMDLILRNSPGALVSAALRLGVPLSADAATTALTEWRAAYRGAPASDHERTTNG